MNDPRFDEPSRALVPPSSRRRLLAGIAGAIGGAFGLVGLGESAGKNKKRKKRKKQKRSPVSPPTAPPICTFTCGSICTDHLNDEANCGACNRACAQGKTCINGGCAQTGCPGTCPSGCTCLSGVETGSTVCGRSITCPTSGPLPQACSKDEECPVGMGCVSGVCPRNPGKPGLCTDFCQ